MWLLLACTLHVGTPPVTTWTLENLLVAVPEPKLEDDLRAALGRALGGMNAQGGAQPRAFVVQVEQAEWRPLMRGSGMGDYEAVLRVLVEAEGTIREFSASSMVWGPHSAAEQKKAREATFAQLSDRVAAQVALWLSGLP